MIILNKRLKNENKNLRNKSTTEKFLFQTSQREYQGWVEGPENSCYSGYLFEIVVRLEDRYPFEAPRVFFRTKIFHPNIHPNSGEVCLDIIKNRWKPVFNLAILLDSLRNLLSFPNADSPLNCDAGMDNKLNIINIVLC